MSFRFEALEIPDVVQVTPTRHGDARGDFSELWRHGAFHGHGITAAFVQDNLVRSVGGVVRGLHYQLPPRAQGKLVYALEGEIYDVAVDLRAGSPTFGRSVACTLSAEMGNGLWIPAGFAHGYAVTSERADVLYKVTAEYDPQRDRGVRWDDPTLAVVWPVSEPVLSEKDRALPSLAEAELPG
ncbi:MAG TPA: dTDP-4-dehydrorhamnose 3,5-epimerase [Longimicrobiales bacterium]|nr:dTDP-4-dehydrorhamnose 3,5-epimerase [Longimicrobiales bacterium]